MKKTILIVENFVHGSLDLTEIFRGNTKVTILRCNVEEQVLHYMETHSVDMIILDPKLPRSFLRTRKILIRNEHIGEVGLVLVREVFKKMEQMEKEKGIKIKRPQFILNTHLSPEELEKVGFMNVRENHVPKPVVIKELFKVMAEDFAAAFVLTN